MWLLFLVLSTEGISGTQTSVLVLTQPQVSQYQSVLDGVKNTLKTENVSFRLADVSDPAQILELESGSDRHDLVLSIVTPASKYAAAHYKEQPVVFAFVLNPEHSGVAGSKNITGISTRIEPQKFLSQAQEFQPELKSIGVLYTPDLFENYVSVLKSAADATGINIVARPVRAKNKFTDQLKAVIRDDVDLFFILPDAGIYDRNSFKYTLLETYKAGIPCIGTSTALVESAALWGLSVSPVNIGEEAGALIADMLKGNNPGPWKYTQSGQLLVNLLTAKKLGIDFPEAVLQQKNLVTYGDR